MKKIIVLSGAGISAESGLKTFRGSDGLWEGHDVMSVASIKGWSENRALVLDFYNQRRRQLKTVLPNNAHKALAKLQKHHDVQIITQNVDDLHERAGNTKVLHLHGALLKSRSQENPALTYACHDDINIGDLAEDGHQLRPDIVWFGEEVPLLTKAIELVGIADIILIVGTSMQVYPAASLIKFSARHAKIFYIDPYPSINHELENIENLKILAEKASIMIPKIVNKIIKNQS